MSSAAPATTCTRIQVDHRGKNLVDQVMRGRRGAVEESRAERRAGMCEWVPPRHHEREVIGREVRVAPLASCSLAAVRGEAADGVLACSALSSSNTTFDVVVDLVEPPQEQVRDVVEYGFLGRAPDPPQLAVSFSLIWIRIGLRDLATWPMSREKSDAASRPPSDGRSAGTSGPSPSAARRGACQSR